MYKYSLNIGYYGEAWEESNKNSNGVEIAPKLKKAFNDATQHYNRPEYRRFISTLATLEETKYEGLAPTIDWVCDGVTKLNGLDKVFSGVGDNISTLGGWAYYESNLDTDKNTLIVEGSEKEYRFGSGPFVQKIDGKLQLNRETQLEYLSEKCMFTSGEGDVVFYAELIPLTSSTYITGSGRYFCNYDETTLEKSNIMTLNELMQKYENSGENYYVVNSMYAYNNTGTFSGSRKAINCNNWNVHKTTTPYLQYTSSTHDNYVTYVPIWGLMYDACSPNVFGMNVLSDNVPRLITTPYLHKAGYFKEPPLFAFDGNFASPCELLDKHQLSFLVGSKAEFHKFFNDLGLKVTFIKEEATSKPVEEWENVPQPPDSTPVEPDIPSGSIEDPEIPSTPNRPTTGTNNGNGGQEGGLVDNEKRPIYDPSSDIQDEGSSATGFKTASTTWCMQQDEVFELNKVFILGELWNNISAYFNNPQDAIINLLKFPFNLLDVNATYINTVDHTLIVGGVEMAYDGGLSTVNARIMHHKFPTKIKIGEFTVPKFFGSFLDYEPYTKITLNLPYVGRVGVKTDYIMGKTCELYYNISWTDGSCIAILQLKNGGHIISTWNGQIGISVPLAKSNLLDNLQGVMKSVAGTAGGLIASMGNPVGVATAATGFASSVLGIANQSTMTTDVTPSIHSRALPPTPYIIYERPITNMLDNHTQIRGVATNIYKPLKELAGFTICKNVKLDNISRALSSEVQELKDLLESGVILGLPNNYTPPYISKGE